jgi:hypothetical protein
MTPAMIIIGLAFIFTMLGVISDGEIFIFLTWLIASPFYGMRNLYMYSKGDSIRRAMKERQSRIELGAINYIKMGFCKSDSMNKAEKDLIGEANRTLNEMNAFNIEDIPSKANRKRNTLSA